MAPGCTPSDGGRFHPSLPPALGVGKRLSEAIDKRGGKISAAERVEVGSNIPVAMAIIELDAV
jgi:hypothetical protein